MPTPTSRLADLRAALAAANLDGFVVPLTDEHMSEYVGGYAQRLEWLTGFGGSAGTAVVLADKAAMFTDGRYTVQVREQVSPADWAYVPIPQDSVAGWLGQHAPDGSRVGYDPWLHTRAWVEQVDAALVTRDGKLVAVDANPIDALWSDRPQPSDAKLAPYDEALAGQSSAAKRAMIGDWLAERKADALVLTALDSIAWALNVRGADVAHTPVALSYAIVDADGSAELFVAPGKVDDAVLRHLGNAVKVRDRAEFAGALGSYAGKRVAADPERSVAAIVQALEAGGATIVAERDPVVLAKAKKNRSRSPATAPLPSATAPRSPASCAGSRRRRPRAARPSSPPPRSCSNSAKRPARSGTPRSTRSQARARTARSRIITSPRNRTRRSSPASSTSSIRAASISTAPPTSPASCPSASPPPKCATASPAC